MLIKITIVFRLAFSSEAPLNFESPCILRTHIFLMKEQWFFFFSRVENICYFRTFNRSEQICCNAGNEHKTSNNPCKSGSLVNLVWGPHYSQENYYWQINVKFHPSKSTCFYSNEGFKGSFTDLTFQSTPPPHTHTMILFFLFPFDHWYSQPFIWLRKVVKFASFTIFAGGRVKIWEGAWFPNNSSDYKILQQ